MYSSFFTSEGSISPNSQTAWETIGSILGQGMWSFLCQASEGEEKVEDTSSQEAKADCLDSANAGPVGKDLGHGVCKKIRGEFKLVLAEEDRVEYPGEKKTTVE